MVCSASFGKKIKIGLESFAQDRRGAVAAYVTALLPILIGGALLTVDAGRLYSLNTSLQAAADAFALAGAAELDGQSQPNADDSITRANRAISTMMASRNQMRLGDAGTAAITVASGYPVYLSALPASDATATTLTTTDPTAARYVQVKVAAANFTTIFPATFLGASTNTTSTSAIATGGGPQAAGGRQICLGPVTPMFICNPYEGNATSTVFQAVDPTDSNYATNRRRQIELQTSAGTYFPGNFGWLDTPELGNGANALRDALAVTNPLSPSSCLVQRTSVSQRTGNVANADDAMNTRFDLWNGPFNNGKSNSAYTPALNVRKGAKPGNGANGACNPSTTAPNANSFPRDGSFSGNIGNGVYDLTAYWTANYGAVQTGSFTYPDGTTGTLSATSSRYDAYLYELQNNKTSIAAVGGPAKDEKGSPQCYSGGSTANYDRRVLYVAIVNCTQLSINGNSGNLGVPFAYGKFFLTEPVSGGVYYSELVGLASDGQVIDVGGGGPNGGPAVAGRPVQLYR